MAYSKISFFTSRMDSSGESLDTCFFVNYKRGLTLPKTELDSMSKRKLTTKFEEPFFVGEVCFIKTIFLLRILKASHISRKLVKSFLRIQDNQATCLYKLSQWPALYIS